MKIFCLIFLMMIMGVCTHANAAPYDFNPALPEISKDYDFRNFIWGVSRADVKRYETAIPYKEEKNSLYFLERPSKRDFVRIIKYDFVQNSLVSAQYSFQDLTYPRPDTIVDLYEKFKGKISTSFEIKETENFIWREKTYQRYPDYWASAIRSEQLKIESSWDLGNKTKITLTLGFKDGYYQLDYAAAKTQNVKFFSPLPTQNISSFNVNP